MDEDTAQAAEHQQQLDERAQLDDQWDDLQAEKARLQRRLEADHKRLRQVCRELVALNRRRAA